MRVTVAPSGRSFFLGLQPTYLDRAEAVDLPYSLFARIFCCDGFDIAGFDRENPAVSYRQAARSQRANLFCDGRREHLRSDLVKVDTMHALDVTKQRVLSQYRLARRVFQARNLLLHCSYLLTGRYMSSLGLPQRLFCHVPFGAEFREPGFELLEKMAMANAHGFQGTR
ncbi:hypothetical protein VI03_25620 [Burkholderia vietnamiensis]|nr:hypothetical protein VI03_25620 [Burkholderia vietnamiensis]